MGTPALLLGLGLAALGVLSIGACSSCKPKPVPSTVDASSPTSLLTPEQASKVLARVGDKTITLGDYVAALEHMDQFDRARYQSPERRKELLDEMINVTLLAQEATDKGYDKDPIAQEQLRAILRDAMLESARKGAPLPNDIPAADVQAYYDAHKADYSDPERRRLSLIVLADEATANQVATQARGTTPAQWGDLARAKSTDPGVKSPDVPREFAGDVGFVSAPGDARGDNPKVPPEVRAAAFEIANVGDVLARPVKSGGKFYVVRFAQKSDPHTRSLAEAERVIRVTLAQDAARTKENALLDTLRAQFPVQIDEQALAGVSLHASTDAGAIDAAGE
jgi:peptidyl-prolyl cis-trans isomerase C